MSGFFFFFKAWRIGVNTKAKSLPLLMLQSRHVDKRKTKTHDKIIFKMVISAVEKKIGRRRMGFILKGVVMLYILIKEDQE